MKRWIATVTYRNDTIGSLDVDYAIDELSEIELIVEQGPDWNAIEKIEIQLASLVSKISTSRTLDIADLVR